MQAWENFLTVQDRELGPTTVKKWLRSLKVLRFDACNLYLEAQDSFQAGWFEEHVRTKVKSTFVNNNSKPIEVHIAIANKEKKQAKRRRPALSPVPLIAFVPDEVNPACTFDKYVVSQKNLIVHKLLCRTCGLDGQPELGTFNPIYIHGPEGTGKTHLLMAAAHALKERGFSPLYVRSDTFTDHVINAIRQGVMPRFRETYRNPDILIIDDVHYFSKKGATQEELFHTFNTLHLAGKQIILSANCSPLELQEIEPRLISRFEWGIVLPLETPPLEEKAKILQQRTQQFNCSLHPKVCEFLLETFESSTSNLCRAAEALILRSHTRGKKATPTKLITVIQAEETLKDLIAEERRSAITPEKIIQATADHFGIKVEDILGKGQGRSQALPRQVAMYLCRDELGLPFMRIGDLFTRDHSTVMASVKSVQKGIEVDSPDIAPHVHTILKKVKLLEWREPLLD